ncbi:ImuA family protein [Sphingomonas sp.]|uniref:ImuA family protein n=1 Tax=Sphingomonas sp. TaxID=28214 RepID=UPI003B3AD81A
MNESFPLPALRAHLSGFGVVPAAARFGFGAEAIDTILGGGPLRARLHEIWPADIADAGSATGFALMLARRAAGPGPIVWITEERATRRHGLLHGPGLAELGLEPGRFLLVRAPDATALLRTAGDVARSTAVGAAVIAPQESAGFDLTATRRLTLFAERSGTTTILLHPADPCMPSAATTRWRIAAASSAWLEADAPGAPAFHAELLRHRGGRPLPHLRMEWDRDRAGFAPLPGAVPADAGGGHLADVG